MKIERLYAITVYLLNHGRTSASRLAAHFEVSLRTIQRDMESLCLSGIPVISIPGAAGGYEISRQFQLDHQLATADDYAFIKTALQGLVSATGDPGAKQALEKIANVSKPSDNGIILDFSVLQEGNTALLQTLQSAISEKRALRFTYTNNNQETRSHCVEPVAVVYRWYAWYLLAYSRVKGDYRTYKLVRMRDLERTDLPFTKEHEPASLILEKNNSNDSRKYLSVLVRCKQAAVPRIREYLNGAVVKESLDDCVSDRPTDNAVPDGMANRIVLNGAVDTTVPNGMASGTVSKRAADGYAPERSTNGTVSDKSVDSSILMELTVVENEQLWLGTLLSLGDAVEVLAPEKLRNYLLETAKKIVSLYQ